MLFPCEDKRHCECFRCYCFEYEAVRQKSDDIARMLVVYGVVGVGEAVAMLPSEDDSFEEISLLLRKDNMTYLVFDSRSTVDNLEAPWELSELVPKRNYEVPPANKRKEDWIPPQQTAVDCVAVDVVHVVGATRKRHVGAVPPLLHVERNDDCLHPFENSQSATRDRLNWDQVLWQCGRNIRIIVRKKKKN